MIGEVKPYFRSELPRTFPALITNKLGRILGQLLLNLANREQEDVQKILRNGFSDVRGEGGGGGYEYTYIPLPNKYISNPIEDIPDFPTFSCYFSL